jgi:hypothetical protein
VKQFGNFLKNNVVPVLSALAGWVSRNRSLVAKLAVAFGAVYLAVKVWTLATKVHAAVMAAWSTIQTVLAARTKIAAAAQWLFNAAMSANPIGLVIIGLVLLVAAIVIAYKKSETFRKIVQAAWRGIQAAAMFAWNNVIKPIFKAYVAYVKVIITAVTWLWRRAISPAFRGISASISFAWNRVIKPVFSALSRFIRTTVPNAFRTGVATIKKYWDGLKKVAKAPINFIIGTVINRGIVGTFNKIAKWLGVKTRLHTITALAAGGVLPGYKPGVDTIPAMLSPGEGVLRPEVVRQLGPERIYAWNKAAKDRKSISLFADGGIAGRLANAAGIGRIADKFGNNALTKLLTALPRKIMRLAVGKLENFLPVNLGRNLLKFATSGSTVGLIMAIAKAIYPAARLSSGYRPGDPGYHGRGLAADIIGGGASGMARIARGFYTISGRLLEEIHSGGGGYFVKNGRRVGPGFYQSVLGQHWNHVHIAASRSSLLRGATADTGTTLAPGWNLRYNGTGRREHLMPAEPAQQRDLNIVLNLDGKRVANVIVDPLRGVVRAKGGGNVQAVLGTR